MKQDPGGFQGFAWGSALQERPGLTKVGSSALTLEYEPGELPRFGTTNVESVRYIAIDGQFARVSVTYHGQENHDAMLAHLQLQYGEFDRTPGQMMAENPLIAQIGGSARGAQGKAGRAE